MPRRTKRRGRWTNLWPLTVLVSLAVLAGAGYWTVMVSNVVDARSVSVSGASPTLTAAEVTAAAELPKGKPLAKVDLAAIRRRVAAIPRVASVSVSRSWPHTVRITVKERRAVAVIPDGTGFTAVDATGMRFATLDARPDGAVLIAATPATDQALLAGTAAIPGALAPELASRITELTPNTRDDVIITLDDGVQIQFGSPDDAKRKAVVLSVLMQRKAKYYDVSVPDAPYTRNSPPPQLPSLVPSPAPTPAPTVPPTVSPQPPATTPGTTPTASPTAVAPVAPPTP